MNLALITLTSGVVLGLLVREYYRQRRVLKKVGSRPGLSRSDFATHFQQRGIESGIATAVFDSLVGSHLAVDPNDDLSTVYRIDHELFLDLLADLQKRTRVGRRAMDAAWKEFGNVSTVSDLVEMIALAHRIEGPHS